MGVSFSAKAKGEVCRNVPQKHCCCLAQCFGILLFCNSFQRESIRIITESRELGSLLPRLFKRTFGVSFDVLPEEDTPGKLNFQITDTGKICRIMEAFGFNPADTLCLHINLPIVE